MAKTYIQIYLGGKWRVGDGALISQFSNSTMGKTSFGLPAGRLAVTSGGVRQPTSAPAQGRFSSRFGFRPSA